MSWMYSQNTGLLSYNGKIINEKNKGYSGKGKHRDKPDSEKVKRYGPIPRGKWKIGTPRNSKKTGRFVLPLTPIGHTAHGRSAFQIHGDNYKKNYSASSGCIILSYEIRKKIYASKDTTLVVVRALPKQTSSIGNVLELMKKESQIHYMDRRIRHESQWACQIKNWY